MAKTLTVILLMLAIFYPANHVIADMYKWVDQNGVIHFSDTPPTSGQKVKTIKTPNYQSPGPSSDTAEPQRHTDPAQKRAPRDEVPKKRNYDNSVQIFTTSWCKYCKRAVAFLRSHRVKFKQYDIEKDPNAARMMYALGGTGGVPFAIINGKQVRGFSANTYKQVLGLK